VPGPGVAVITVRRAHEVQFRPKGGWDRHCLSVYSRRNPDHLYAIRNDIQPSGGLTEGEISQCHVL
jgi:hypothetical protein